MVGVLINTDGSVPTSFYCFILSIPLLANGYHRIKRSHSPYNDDHDGTRFTNLEFTAGIGIFLLGIYLVRNTFLSGKIEETKEDELAWLDDSQTSPLQIMNELKKSLEQRTLSTHDEEDREAIALRTSLRCLSSLASICERQRLEIKQRAKSDSTNIAQPPLKSSECEVISQEACYLILQTYPENDTAISEALSVLSLTATNETVRTNYLHQADAFGLNVPVKIVRDALDRAKSMNEPNDSLEQDQAELQRRGCLFLGALAHGDEELSYLIVQEGGMDMILNAVRWYRCHANVANWALFALFTLCYDNVRNQSHLTRLDGIRTICRVMTDVPNSVEVQRHGMAILFDLTREGGGRDVGLLRSLVVESSLHQIVVKAMEEYKDSNEIVMMGRQMLVATGYNGDIL